MDNPKTVEELLTYRDQLLYELALWDEMKSHLGKFLDNDAGKAKIGIATKGRGGVVPQDIIMEAELGVDATIEELKESLRQLEQIEVAKNEPTAEKKSEGTATQDRPAGKKARKQEGPDSGAQ